MKEFFGGGGTGTAEASEHREPGVEVTQEELDALGVGKDKIEIIEMPKPEESRVGLMEKIRKLTKRPVAKVGMAALFMVMALGAKANAAAAEEKAVSEFARKSKPITAEFKGEMSAEQIEFERTSFVQTRMVEVFSKGILQKVDLNDYSISLEKGSVRVEGMVMLNSGDLAFLNEVCKIEKGSVLEKDVKEAEKKIAASYADIKNVGARKLQMKNVKNAFENKTAIHMLLYSKMFYEAQKDPDNQKLQAELKLVQDVLIKDMVTVAAFNNLL